MTSPLNLQVRPAREDESDLIADLVFGEPEQETTRVAMCLYGIDDADRARRLFRLLWKSGGNWRHSLLAVRNGAPVAVLQFGRSGFQMSPGLIARLIRIAGPIALLRMASRMRLNAKLSPAKPAGALIVSELHVSPEARGMGIGAALLEHAEVEARRRGTATLALQTLTTNPARHLYERSGFEVRATTSNKSFLQLTGCEGNVLMVKEIAAAPAVNGLEPSR